MPPPKKSAKAGAKYSARRDAILAAALELFRTNGYDRTSLQQIADASGLLKGSLYYYIPSKEDVLVALVEQLHEAFGTTLQQYREVEGPALARIRALLYSAALDAGKNRNILTVFYREFPKIEEERRSTIIELRDEQERILADLIAEGQADGEIRSGVDAKVAAIGLEAMANSVYNWYRPDGRISLEAIADELADLAVEGLRAPG